MSDVFSIYSRFLWTGAGNRPLPDSLAGDRPGRWYPCSSVLPMGFKNSVALAQHVHRVITKNALVKSGLGGESEMRKDKAFSSANPLFRIYLDNFDELSCVSSAFSLSLAGRISPLVAALRGEYELRGVPRHPKSVSSQVKTKVHGGVVDGRKGIVYPKPAKVLKYAMLTRMLVGRLRLLVEVRCTFVCSGVFC